MSGSAKNSDAVSAVPQRKEPGTYKVPGSGEVFD